MRWLYTIFYAVGFVALSPLFLYKMWKRGKYRENFFQRFGRYAPELRDRLAAKTAPRIWLQAVSVGEVNLALHFSRALARAFPQHRLVLTTTTSTGYALARDRLTDGVELVYFPQDFPWTVRRAYDLIQPDFIVLMESELWPNFIWEGARRHVPLYLVNARMSPRSARRYHRFAGFTRHIVSPLTLIAAQSEEDANSFLTLGLARDRVQMTGNMKYDASLPTAGTRSIDPVQILKDMGISPAQPILVAGSTHPGEEEILFNLLKQTPGLLLVLVPRHVERTPEILELARRMNVRVALRKGEPVTSPDCLLVNTTGELRWFYEIATVIFVGKSLVGEGGQNILEAAATGHPVIFGPHMQNFRAIAAQFVAAGAGVQVADAAGLQRAVPELLADSPRREKIAAAARCVIEANVGATERTVQLLATSFAR